MKGSCVNLLESKVSCESMQSLLSVTNKKVEAESLGSQTSLLDSRFSLPHFTSLSLSSMFYLGIDVSSIKLNIHCSGPTASDFEIPNTLEALQNFISEQVLNPSEYVVGVESTGKYHLICQKVFVQQGFEFRVLNPILTNKKIVTTIRKKKTDVSDARIIVQLLIQGEGQIIYAEQDLTKRTILRIRKTIVHKKSALKILVQDTQRVPNNIQINQTIEALNNLIEDMEECIAQLEDCAFEDQPSDTEVLIQSIPGFAMKLSAVIAAETGDFKRFPSATQYKAYVGIDPKVNQSGGSLRTGHITKRGNPYLRHAFYLAAQVSRRYDPELKAFYEKKVAQGKNFRVALCAVARKLCERVYAVATKQTPYIIRQPSFS